MRNLFTYLLMALIALQSLTAVADFHQPHQSGVDHIEFNHDHPAASDIAEQPLNQERLSSTQLYDCHHCCHCHAMGHLFFGQQVEGILSLADTSRFEYRRKYVTAYLPPALRPPIL